MNECKTCKGSGHTVRVQNTIFGAVQSRVQCGTCHGAGTIPEKACTTCKGEGTEYARKTVRVDIPSGVENGNRMRLRGQGEAIKGGVPGDLFIQLRVLADKRFEREGDNIYSEVKIGFTQAAIGDTIEVDTVDGKVKLSIPAGTQSSDKLRLKAKGVPHGRGRGDHIVIVTIVTPKKLSRKEKELLEELNLRT
jgi:molecular chaperone DnaJ